jgi:hypothetical protein
MSVMNDMHESHLRMAHYSEKLLKKIMTFPLDKEDLLWLNRSMNWHYENVFIPMTIMWDDLCGRVKLSPEDRDELLNMFNENMLSDKNVFGMGYKRLYQKYDRPKRLERNKKRNRLLAEAHFGSEKNRYEDYRGLVEDTEE